MASFTVVIADATARTNSSPLPALVLFGILGPCLIFLGRRQRRSGRTALAPTQPFQFGGTLHEPPPPRMYRRALGGLFEFLGWILLVLAVLAGIVLATNLLS